MALVNGPLLGFLIVLILALVFFSGYTNVQNSPDFLNTTTNEQNYSSDNQAGALNASNNNEYECYNDGDCEGDEVCVGNVCEKTAASVKDEWKECVDDSECVETHSRCCSCRMGGGQTAINKEYLELWKRHLSKSAVICGCRAVINCVEGSPKCINNMCEFVPAWKSYTCPNTSSNESIIKCLPDRKEQPYCFGGYYYWVVQNCDVKIYCHPDSCT